MKEIVLFVSSTFSDMIDERDLLVRAVFPRLKHFCKERGLIFRTIDLRWGITQEQADDLKQTIDICLKRVNDSVPLFLSFIGQRYGWVPSPEYLSAIQCDHPEATKAYCNRSATELEIIQALHAAFYDGEPKRCLFFFKDPSYLETILDENIRKKYLEESEEGRERLNALRQSIEQTQPDYWEYTSEFVPLDLPAYLRAHNAEQPSGVTQTNFRCNGAPLEDKLFECLAAAITEATRDLPRFEPHYQGEVRQKYLLNHYRCGAPVESVDSYLQECLKTERGTLHGLYMPEAQGKSSSLARFAVNEQKRNAWVFYRFLGGDSHTRTVKSVLHTLAEEIAARSGQEFDPNGGHIYDLTLLQACLNRLYEAGEDSILVLDGLNKTQNTYVEWLDFFRSLSAGHIIFSTENQETRLFDAPYFDVYQKDELFRIIRYHFEQFGKCITEEQAEILTGISQGRLVNLMHIVRYLVRFSTFESLEDDMCRLGSLSHLDAIVRIDDEYSKLQPLCVHWNEHTSAMQGMLSYVTYTLMICRDGATYDELCEIVFDLVSLFCPGTDRKTVNEIVTFELRLLSDELDEADGVYSIKDPFYADFLICELNRSLMMRRFYFERIVEHFCRFATSDKGCPRHFDTVREILENVTGEDLERLLTSYCCNREYLEAMIRIMGYSYLMRCMERYYVQSLNYAHLLGNTPENRYQIRRLLWQTPSPQNEIGVIRTLFLTVPLGFRQNGEAALAFIATVMRSNGLHQRSDLEMISAFYSAIGDYSDVQFRNCSACLQLDPHCRYQRNRATVYLDMLYVCGTDDRVYVYDLNSGECDTVIQLQRGDEALCLFYFEQNIFIVGKQQVYCWNVVQNVNVAYDYVKNTSSALKDASTSPGGEVAFWYKNGLIKRYRRMQPLLEIDDLIGSEVEYVWATEIDGDALTVALVGNDGYYIFRNDRLLLRLSEGFDRDLLSERFAGITDQRFYFTVSHGQYRTLDLRELDVRQVDQPIHGSLRIEADQVITADENGRITVDGAFTGLNRGIEYSEFTCRTLYLIDETGSLRVI